MNEFTTDVLTFIVYMYFIMNSDNQNLHTQQKMGRNAH